MFETHPHWKHLRCKNCGKLDTECSLAHARHIVECLGDKAPRHFAALLAAVGSTSEPVRCKSKEEYKETLSELFTGEGLF